jgi:hypothetical protein
LYLAASLAAAMAALRLVDLKAEYWTRLELSSTSSVTRLRLA